VIEWLGGWLKSIIMIILIATFIDLLLPNHSLQRYVKTVVSLFVLMALLSPIAQLFQKSWNVDGLLKSEQQRWEQNDKAPDYLQNPAAIMSQGKSMQAIDNKQALTLTENEIEQQVKKQLQNSTGIAAVSVQAAVALDAHSSPQLQRITVSFAQTDLELAVRPVNGNTNTATGQTSGAGASSAGRFIKPVDIHLAPISLDNIPNQPANSAAKKELPPEVVKWKQQVMQSLQTDWQLKPEQIDIEIQ
jgi:stage III sporulation protein AF